MHTRTGTLTPERIRERFESAPTPRARPIRIGEGNKDDYDSLARLHYRAGAPATIAKILTARDETTDEITGVLVVSRPTLNGKWRQTAWPGKFDTGTKTQRAHAINAELRTISRVIIDPRYRGLGVAKSLVRTYIDAPLTPCTEAITAMGPICPFFERAGMTRIDIELMRRDARLLERISQLAQSPCDLLTNSKLRKVLESKLRTWARQSAATRSIADGPIELIARAAAARLIAPPIAYAHTAD